MLQMRKHYERARLRHGRVDTGANAEQSVWQSPETMMGLDGMRMPPSLDSWTTGSLQKVLPLSTKEGGWGFSVE